MKRDSLTRFAWLSILAAIITITLKTIAYLLTGSVGLLSDAVESVVNLLGALMALWMLTIAARPPDESHMFGHSKAEYFASGVEGFLILIAAGSIGFAAIGRIIHPRSLDQIGWGLAVSTSASLINLAVAQVLKRSGKKFNSITLEADSAHLMTDVWTSVGVILAVIIVSITKWVLLDPLIALVVAANIIWTGVRLVGKSVSGLMDSALPLVDQEAIEAVLERYRQQGVDFHALRTRQSAARRFVSVHMLVPGDMSVHDAHHIAENLEKEIHYLFGEAVVFTHLEPIEDEISSLDIELDRAKIKPKEGS